MAPVDVVLRFVVAINAHDMAAVAGLMTGDHRFVDSLGAVVSGEAQLREAWQAYFNIVPDYRIDVRETFDKQEVVVLLGTARGTYAPDGTLSLVDLWETPAAWRAVVRGDRVAEWRVYADNGPLRQRIAAHSAQQADATDRRSAGR